MNIKIKVWSDYVCPFCLLAEGPIREATEGQEDVRVEWGERAETDDDVCTGDGC
jgi:predicted DsbA family dithiol-disulfide isomerase